MKILFASKGWQHYRYWAENDKAILLRLNMLIEECRRTPFSGLGKPEPLRGEFRGFGPGGSQMRIVSFIVSPA